MLAIAEMLYPVWVVLFTAIFVGIAVWAFWPSQRQRRRMSDHADIPFRGDDEKGRQS
jgi:cbb3-type cytochrome oxidase subunit 3